MRRRVSRAFAVLLVLTLSSACYLYGFLREVPDSLYTGIRSINASDYNQHLTWIGQGREGRILQKNLFTSEIHDGLLIRPVYFVLSLPFALSSASNTVVFHVLRILCGVVLLFALFRLFRAYGMDKREVWIAFFLLTLASGGGFLFRRWLPHAADLHIPETTLFLSLGEAPHFLFSLLFLWTGITAFYRRTLDRAAGLWLYFAALGLLWLEHPFDAVILICVCAANLWQVDSRAKVHYLVGTALLSIPAYLYYEFLKSQPAFSGWGSAQNLMISPELPSLLIAFLPLLLIGVPGTLKLYRSENQRKLLSFVLLWAVTQFVLAYLPFPFQRRLIAGVQFPLVILAAYGLSQMKSTVLAAGVIVISSLGSGIVMHQQIRDIGSGGMPYYLPETYRTAFQWLSKQERKGAVLSAFVTGNFVPAYTGFQSYMGHSSLTPRVEEKRRYVKEFYSSPERSDWRNENIQYVFWGAEERHLSNGAFRPVYPQAYAGGSIVILQAGAPGSNAGEDP